MERHIIESGIILLKYWLEVGNAEQKRRFEARIEDKSANGSFHRWTCRRANAGTTIPARAT